MKRTLSTAFRGNAGAAETASSLRKDSYFDGMFPFDSDSERELVQVASVQVAPVQDDAKESTSSGKSVKDIQKPSPNSVLSFFNTEPSFVPIDEDGKVSSHHPSLKADFIHAKKKTKVEVHGQTQLDPYLFNDKVYKCDYYKHQFMNMFHDFLLEETDDLFAHMNDQGNGENDFFTFMNDQDKVEDDWQWGQYIPLDRPSDETFISEIMDLLDEVEDVLLTQMVHYIADALTDAHGSKFDQVKNIFSQWRATCSPLTQLEVDEYCTKPTALINAMNKPTGLSQLLSKQPNHQGHQASYMQVSPRNHKDVLDEILPLLDHDFLNYDAQKRVFIRYHLHNISLKQEDVLALKAKNCKVINIDSILDNRAYRAETNNARKKDDVMRQQVLGDELKYSSVHSF